MHLPSALSCARWIWIGLALMCLPGLPSVWPAEPAATESLGPNLAMGKQCLLFPAPNYQLCTDPDDPLQLTDGQSTKDYFWTQKGTVGWQSIGYATVTIDLGRVEPIRGVAVTTAAGVAGVTWPMAIHVLVSDDGQAYTDAGDLVALDRGRHGPWPTGYAIRRLVTDELQASGRFVQLVLIPLPGGPYLFADEVEVFRGPDTLLEQGATRQPVTTALRVFEEGRLERAVAQRFDTDAAGLEDLIRTAGLAEADQTRHLQRLAAVRGLVPDKLDFPTGSGAASQEKTVPPRIVLPLGPRHAELFQTQAEVWRSLGRRGLEVSAANPWDPVDLIGVPSASDARAVQVDALRGEYRAAAVNLANTTTEPLQVRLRFQDLPGSPAPDYVVVHEVQWTDSSQGIAVAAALPEAKREGDAWSVTVLPGVVRQVWFTFHPVGLQPGEYKGQILLEPSGGAAAAVPVRLKVWPWELPQPTRLLLGGWSYTDGDTYGVTAQNRAAFLEHLQNHFVNAPWATAAVMMSFTFDARDPAGIQLDTRRFDQWLAQWPNAQRYMVFLAVGDASGTTSPAMGGAEIGSADFQARVGLWIRAWVRHLGAQGIGPERLGLLIHDEPHEASQVGAMVAWARAIRAAEPKVLIWEDPTYQNPAAGPAELFEVCDVLCPNRPMWLEHGEPFRQFYREQQRRGRTLEFYSCSGPAKLLDPYSYYRLQAWQAWQVGGTGSFFWAFGDNSGASSWNEYFAKAGPFTPLFLDDSTVTAGKQMEAIRESVEDFECLSLLQRAVAAARAKGRADAAVDAAERLLKSAADQVLSAAGADQIHWHQPKDRTLADQVRVRVLEALLALQG